MGGSFTATVASSGEITAVADRTCTIPVGTALFIPVVNAEAATLEGNGTTESELRAAAKSFQDVATNLSMEVDGATIQNLNKVDDVESPYRVQSPLYVYGPLPDNNVVQKLGFDAPVGATSNSVADGVYVMLAPLSAGQHTIHFHGEAPAFNFLLDITYRITVVGR